jgi:redox-sensitive bicupin YhaK (pirin superfamily)
MITLRPASARGRTRIDWLDSRHTFSFGDYMDPAHMGFNALRVINDDRVKPGVGFGTHGHRDMEIVSYVLEGELGHKDSLGNGSTIRPGEVQRMTAGTGVLHSEMNPSREMPVHFLQIWIVPERRGLEPGYEQKAFAIEASHGRWLLVASRDGRDGSVTIHQDVAMYAARLNAGERAPVALREGRAAWLHVARGSVSFGGHTLREGDGAAIENERELDVTGAEDGGEVLLFDLAQ